ncbi:AraC family transcriptional regulator [Geobacter sp. DSM 9736]|uniref:helix-turn-helix domain-containing protein n=1 Tax=Geobacter sp. DSM 9736 TaxID=1277350 RepID=UPI000B502D04|nr:AraC family transcriptional regulator [Geobacter sp. DSM 9736]SNB45325.1 transcriptional regulator, AraC family [Geobacter sp. DSM 9736]
MIAEEINCIRSLVGDVSPEQLRYVECFVGRRVALFVPAVGPCFYAVTPDHSHPAYSFVMGFDDQTKMVAGGEVRILQAGQVMAMDPDAEHQEIISDTPPRYIAIMVEREHFEEELYRYPAIPRQPFDFRSFSPGPELIILLKEFMKEADARLPGRDVLLDAIGTRIVHSIIRAAFPLPEKADRIGERIDIHRVIEHLHRHYDRKLQVADMARIAAMSTAHFSRVFRQETGHPPLEYLIRLRLQKARLLLLAGNENITAIGLRCGFATPSHFATCFQQHYATTPSEYRRTRG